MSVRLVLIRHGESNCSLRQVVGGMVGCDGLSDAGMAQAAALERRLVRTGELSSATAFYSSVLRRAVQTAEMIASGVGDGQLEMVQRCDLCELHPGDADGLTWLEYSDKFGDPHWESDPSRPIAPGGESWVDFVDRASDAVERVASVHPGETVVIACHAGVVEATMLKFLPSVTGRLKLRTSNTSITEWEFDDGAWRLVRYNDSAHLAELGL